MARTTIYVYADWKQVNGPSLMGELYVDHIRGKETFSFKYEDRWIQSNHATILDPDLQLYTFPQFLADEERELFGVFTDSCPDRWGRVLMQRKEFATARAEERPEKELFTSDYLLGVYDEHRMGGLRFKLDHDGPFLNDDERMITPPMTSLRELEYISTKVQEDAVDDPDYLEWIMQLIGPGSSLGGARPKVGVIDADGHLWIAKFPATADTSNMGAWEMVVHELAQMVGLNVPDAQLMQFASKHHTYLNKRFDREGTDRIHFTSAMTMLGEVDHHDNASYLDLANWISINTVNPVNDLEELYKRMVFNVCVGNVDDHLRNHGFILGDHGWELSPLYDVNPSVDGTHLRLNITDNAGPLDLNVCLDVCDFFQLEKDQASNTINQIDQSTRSFRDVATETGIPNNEILLMERAFTKRTSLEENAT